MANVPKTHEDIEAQVQEIQSRNKKSMEEIKVGLMDM